MSHYFPPLKKEILYQLYTYPNLTYESIYHMTFYFEENFYSLDDVTQAVLELAGDGLLSGILIKDQVNWKVRRETFFITLPEITERMLFHSIGYCPNTFREQKHGRLTRYLHHRRDITNEKLYQNFVSPKMSPEKLYDIMGDLEHYGLVRFDTEKMHWYCEALI